MSRNGHLVPPLVLRKTSAAHTEDSKTVGRPIPTGHKSTPLHRHNRGFQQSSVGLGFLSCVSLLSHATLTRHARQGLKKQPVGLHLGTLWPTPMGQLRNRKIVIKFTLSQVCFVF